jgi:hypothetical protein
MDGNESLLVERNKLFSPFPTCCIYNSTSVYEPSSFVSFFCVCVCQVLIAHTSITVGGGVDVLAVQPARRGAGEAYYLFEMKGNVTEGRFNELVSRELGPVVYRWWRVP